MIPSDAILRAFGADEDEVTSVAGSERTWRSGSRFLKFVDDPREARWVADVFATLPQVGFRVPGPVRAPDGSWVVDGWIAHEWVDAVPAPSDRWERTFATSRSFHIALEDVPPPDFLGSRSDPWSRADRVAWGEADPPDCSEPMSGILARLIEVRRPLSMPRQVVHGDLTGNVLFASDGGDPYVIDFVPYHRPSAFADAIVVVDALAWEGADEGILDLVGGGPECGQLLVRALLYRMATVAFACPDVVPRLEAEVRANTKGLSMATRLIG